MGQLMYAFVARGTVVLAECARFEGNFNAIALQRLERILQEEKITEEHHRSPPEEEKTTGEYHRRRPQQENIVNKFTSYYGSHSLNYLLDDGFAYMVLADKDVTRQVIFECMERVKDDFQNKYGEIAPTLASLSLNKDYGPELKALMKRFSSHLLALPEALILKIVLKSAASSPKAPFLWRSLCRKLRRVLSEDDFWKDCFLVVLGEREASLTISEHRQATLSAGEPWLRMASRWMFRYAESLERLIAGSNWKSGRGRECGVRGDAITEALITSGIISEKDHEALRSRSCISFSAVKLESNLLFLALSERDLDSEISTWNWPIVVWDLEKQAVQSICVGHVNEVMSLEVDRWGTKLLSVGYHDEIRIWDIESGMCLCVVPRHFEESSEVDGSTESLHWIDVERGVERNESSRALVPKQRVSEEPEEWDLQRGTPRTRPAWPGIPTSADSARNPAPGYWYWGLEEHRDPLPNESNLEVLGNEPGQHTFLPGEGLSLKDGVLHWVYITHHAAMLPGKVATVWTASPKKPIPFPIRRFKHALCFDNQTRVIAIAGHSPLRIHLADVITGQELQSMSLSTGSDQANEAAVIRQATFSHSDSGAWRLVVILESNMLLVADVSTGQSLVTLHCGPNESFYPLSLLGRIFAVKCPWVASEIMEELPPSRQFSLVDVESQTFSRFEDLEKEGNWIPLQIKNSVGGDSATSIWLSADHATVLLWTEPGREVATLPFKESCSYALWFTSLDKMDSNWRWLAIPDDVGIRIWDFLKP